jgi:hypothetical protein
MDRGGEDSQVVYIPQGQAKALPTWAVRLTLVFVGAVFTLGAVAMLSDGVWIGGLVFGACAVLTTSLALVVRTRRRS